jgi:hypothetical protein
MNLRILKKLSKRAAPYLVKVGDMRQQFPAEKHDNYTNRIIRDRSCWERGASVHGDVIKEGEIKWLARNPKGRGERVWCYMWPPSHPLKGTPMVGAMSGYYEPEWDEETAWEALREWVWCQCYDFESNRQTRALKLPSDFFRAADELISAAVHVHEEG